MRDFCSVADRTCRLDSLVPNTPRPGAPSGYKCSTVKRKANFDTPATSKATKATSTTSPGGSKVAKDGANEVSNGLRSVFGVSGGFQC